MRERTSFEREIANLDLREHEQEQWGNAVLRAILGGERRINALVKIGRTAGGPNDKTVRVSVLKYLRVPFPQAAQVGGIKCEKDVRKFALSNPDTPRIILTGRYESMRANERFFWAINQAGNTVIAIRTVRAYTTKDQGKTSRGYRELRGDIQSDGTAVLFQADDPSKFWGYLQLQPDRTIRWHDGSYLGADGKRVFVDGDSERDEVLQLSADNRPTMMESLFLSGNKYLSELLRQREWYPLTKGRYEFLEEGARSDVLRDLLADYLKTPKGITSQEKQAKQTATGRIVNYMNHLLWNGDPRTKPEVLDTKDTPPALKAYGARARKLFPYGHHNNALLAAHVAKMWLAYEKLNHSGEKRSFLDWLTKLVQERQEARLAGLLGVTLDPSQTGKHRYRLTLKVATGGWLFGAAFGDLVVEKLSSPRWPGVRHTFDVMAGKVIWGKPQIPAWEEVFDLEVETSEEWALDDFEGTLWLGEISASVGYKSVKPGAKVMGGYLRSKNGKMIAIEDGEVFVKPGSPGGKSKKPKFKVGFEGMVGTVRRQSTKLVDLSTPFSASKKVTGNLVAAAHFCFGSSLLTPAARQFLRVVCADQLAMLRSPARRIVIIGHTDRPDSTSRNQELSEMRAKNVETALKDILGEDPKVPDKTITTVGFGEWLALFKLRREDVKNPDDRRVDLLINGSLVATFRE